MDGLEFIRKFQNLYRTKPHISNWTRQSENCDYGDIVVVSRNSYLCFWSSNLENCFYLHESRKNRDCGDCMSCEDCELCYECLDCLRCYNSDFCQDCQQCTDCSYCYGCIGCTNCFGCAGLRRKEFHIFNEPYSKEGYFKKKKELLREDALQINSSLLRAHLAKAKRTKCAVSAKPSEKSGSAGFERKLSLQFNEVQQKTPRVFMHQSDNEHSFGDYLHHSKNCFWCFESYLCEDSAYIFNANLERGTKDSIDCGPIANTFERCYDIAFAGYLFDCNHIYWCDYLHNCEWVINAWDLNHCYGCTYIKNHEYQFLNQPISKNEYETVTKKLNKELAAMGVKDLYGLVNYQ